MRIGVDDGLLARRACPLLVVASPANKPHGEQFGPVAVKLNFGGVIGVESACGLGCRSR